MTNPTPTPLPQRVVAVDRSRIETAETCMRKRWLAYHELGMGLERGSLSIDLEVGKTTHAILACVWVMLKQGVYHDNMLDAIITSQLGEFEKAIRERGIAMELATGYEQAEDGTIAVAAPIIDFTINLYKCWIRNSVTAWCSLRAPYYVNNYDIIEVETEQELPLADGQLLLLSRPDAILRRRSDGEYFILNFKTVGEANQWWREQWPTDMQTISEILPVEAKHGFQISGVIIEGLVKGAKKVEFPRGSGQWWSSSPFCWCWIKPAALPFPPELASKYEWVDEDGNTRRLGKGFTRQPVWEAGTVGGWLNWLIQNDPDLVRAQFVDLPPILRSQRDCDRWLRQVQAREMQIANSVELVNSSSPEHTEEALDALFPMATSGGNCIRPSRCQFFDVCWGLAGMNPLEQGFRQRVPNHPKEAELQGGQQ